MPKLKVLLVGTIGDAVDDFCSKLRTLQKSTAGPFDVCFACAPGPTDLLQKQEFPLPVYLPDPSKEGLVELSTNLYALGGADVWSIDIKKEQIVVACCPPHVRLDSPLAARLVEKISHVAYVGCDFMFSSEWPQGIEQVLSADNKALQVGSFDVAEIALKARPRYLLSPHTVHLQSLPFHHLAATSSTFTPKHIGRFITLASVVPSAKAKSLGKPGKFIHALGLTPLQSMTAEELESASSSAGNIQPCPFTDASYEKDGTSTNGADIGLSEAQARRLLSESTTNNASGDTHTRWNINKRKRRDQNEQEEEEQEVDPTNTTLFLHGLDKDVRGKLQTANATLLVAFQKFKVERVRRPPAGSSYAFLEFPSHEAALKCLEELGGETEIEGVHLTLKWATRNPKRKEDRPPKKHRMTEAEAIDSSTLFFRLPTAIPPEEYAEASETLRKLMETSLESALGDDDVTAETEPALQVKAELLPEKHFGFLRFASHAAASMAAASLTASTDGGMVAKDSGAEFPFEKIPPKLLGVILHWANDAPQAEGDSKVKFQRHHFPPDSRTDCWFCLASPTCEKHLICSVHNECYTAMPKGPIDPGHVLLVPVSHSSKGALMQPSVSEEMEDLKAKLRKHASEVYQKELFVFERAIQTRGGYHTHVQCIPVKAGLGVKIQATMMGMARSTPGFDLKELNSDLALSAFVSNDDEDDEGYFYAEVPVSAKECKRFLYKAKTMEGQRRTVPSVQFGREVLATVLEKPDFAHWKACVVDEEKETEIADAFRESSAKYLT